MQERIDAWRKEKKSIGYVEQCRSLTLIRQEHPEWASDQAHSQQKTLKRVHLAFAAFFRRVAANKRLPKSKRQPVGFPRYKSAKRYRGWTMTGGEGVKYKPKTTASGRWFNGKVFISGIGAIVAKGKARGPATLLREVTVFKKHERWYASLVVDMDVRRFRTHDATAGADWGMQTMLTLAYGPGQYIPVANDRLRQKQMDKEVARAQRLAKALRGRRSRQAARLRLISARRQAHLANQRKDRAHKLSAALVKTHGCLAFEDHGIANITRSAKGTLDEPGKNVAQKAGLNREILDTAPAMLKAQIKYKAAEAGTELVFVSARKHKPSQTCPMCLSRQKKKLSERQHRCGCGFAASRDEAAALAVLGVMLRAKGQELTWDYGPETPATAA